MALETAQYIHQLESANPAATDQLAQADDHLRLIKATLQATFPNIEGPVTATHEELNSPFSLHVGFIGLWYGSSASIPSGYAWCNGGTYALSDGSGNITTPDLRDRVVIGAGAVAQGQTAGSATSSVSTGSAGTHGHTITGGSHSHGGAVAGHALTEAELPAHKHGNGVVDSGDSLFNHGGLAASPSSGQSIDGNDADGTREGYTTSVGGGQAHSHDLQIEAATHSHEASEGGAHTHSVSVSTIQPCYALHYIMRI